MAFITLTHFANQRTFSAKSDAITSIDPEKEGAMVRIGNISIHVYESRPQILEMIEKQTATKGDNQWQKKHLQKNQ